MNLENTIWSMVCCSSQAPPGIGGEDGVNLQGAAWLSLPGAIFSFLLVNACSFFKRFFFPHKAFSSHSQQRSLLPALCTVALLHASVKLLCVPYMRPTCCLALSPLFPLHFMRSLTVPLIFTSVLCVLSSGLSHVLVSLQQQCISFLCAPSLPPSPV